MKEVSTYTVEICMAGDIDHAKKLLRNECYQRGLCVTITPMTFIYTGGEEHGFSARCVNYPRFPCEPKDVWKMAEILANILVPSLNQKTALLVAPDKTAWVQIDPPGARNDKL